MPERKIIKHYNGCEVTAIFKGYNPDVRSNVLWLLVESFEERVKAEIENKITGNAISVSA